MERMMLMRPRIIAMKGHPCTGKSTLARSMVEDLKCPLLAHDDVRDSIAFLQESLETKCLDEQSHEAICQIALTHLRLRQDVIIDSSLCRRTYLDQLLQISASAGASLVIVECNPQDKYEWQLWLELRGANAGNTKTSSGEPCWYKPSNWEDLEKYLCGSTTDYDTGDVSKITVDTTLYVNVGSLVFAIQRLSNSPGIHCIDYHDWFDKLAKGLIEDWGVAERKDGPKKLEIIQGGEGGRPHLVHSHILVFSEGKDDNNYEDNCKGCLEPIISGPRYKCKHCKITLHQSCVELPNKKEIRPQDYPPFLQDLIPHKYSFSVMAKCDYCEFYDTECHECIYEAYIRSAEFPSALQHPCHDHPLHAWMVPISYESTFLCQACGDPGKNVGYYCYDCGFQCHLACGLLPHTSELRHHRHPLTISVLPQDRNCDEFYCNACEETRNQKHWIYYCVQCGGFGCHLSCMTFK